MRHTHSLSHSHSLSCLVALGTQNGFTTNDNNVSDTKVSISISISNSLFLSYSNSPFLPLLPTCTGNVARSIARHISSALLIRINNTAHSPSLCLSLSSCCSPTFHLHLLLLLVCLFSKLIEQVLLLKSSIFRYSLGTCKKVIY